jgi:hypothetical protein
MSEEVKVIKPAEKYEVVVVDTLNSIQTDLYMSLLDEKTMVSRDKWKDFGVEVYMLYEKIKSIKGHIIQILGKEGSGKSYGIKYLNPETTLWIHTDRKPITFKGGNKVWKPENRNFTEVPRTFKEIMERIVMANEKKLNPDQPLYVFILGHIEDYKGADDAVHQRLKLLGSMATKMNVEGGLVNSLYTNVTWTGDKLEYKLDTKSSGFNTARTQEDLFPTRLIDNNFQLIVDALKNY